MFQLFHGPGGGIASPNAPTKSATLWSLSDFAHNSFKVTLHNNDSRGDNGESSPPYRLEPFISLSGCLTPSPANSVPPAGAARTTPFSILPKLATQAAAAAPHDADDESSGIPSSPPISYPAFNPTIILDTPTQSLATGGGGIVVLPRISYPRPPLLFSITGSGTHGSRIMDETGWEALVGTSGSVHSSFRAAEKMGGGSLPVMCDTVST